MNDEKKKVIDLHKNNRKLIIPFTCKIIILKIMIFCMVLKLKISVKENFDVWASWPSSNKRAKLYNT